ncbi:MAG TPA: hypothetical protein VGG61_01355 [Gemmataceae bacterium]|jgi:hypothetical protein
MAAGFAAALIFIVLLMADVILGLFVICYAGHCFLVAMQDTAAGNDEVTWPDEPMQDWAVRGLYMVGMVAVWLAPIGILRGVLRSHAVADDVTLVLLGVGATLLWLMFPISLLSSLSGSSRLFLLRGAVLRQLIRIPGALLVFYFVSAFLFASWLALVYFTLIEQSWLLLALAAIAGPVVLLIYARLLGRISWILSQLKPVKRKMKEAVSPVPGVEIDAHDPWAAPVRKRKLKKKKNAPKAAPAVSSEESYAFADEPPPPQPTEAPLDGFPAIGAETFDVHEPPATPKDDESVFVGRSISRGDREEEILATPSKPTAPPERPLLDGVYSFPWYASNRKVLVFLALGLFCMGALALLMEPPGG